MKIEVQEFENGVGVRFLIVAQNVTEEALLMACVDSDSVLEETEDKCNEFYLRLPVWRCEHQ